MIRRILSLVICAVLALGCAAAPAEEAPASGLERRQAPLNVDGDVMPGVMASLYFLDGVEDLPYVDLGEFTLLMNALCSDGGTDFSGSFVEGDRTFRIVYDPNGSLVSFDFAEQTVLYTDFDSFGAVPGRPLMDVLDASGVNERTNEPVLFSRVSSPRMDRPGTVRVISLEEYDIPMAEREGLHLIPMHTAFDLLINMPMARRQVYWAGGTVYIGSYSRFVTTAIDPDTGEVRRVLSELGEAAFGDGPALRSPQLARYALGELCMELDCFYGLREAHNISDFAWLMVDSGYLSRLIDADPAVADAALAEFVSLYLDDLHSSFELHSPMTGAEFERPTGVGYSTASDRITMVRYMNARDQAFPDGVPFYQEVGNTAYVTFDHFDIDPTRDYYALDPDDPECVQDTISLIIFANRQIRREGSPVENVVLDLSLNSGGKADAAIYVLGWFLGRATVTSVNTFSGAQATSQYLVDTNLDHAFTAEDSLAGSYNLYCLISPESFSCGNLVPWALKASGLATLLGDTSGGGSCVVLPMTTAWGTSFNISGMQRLSFVKNGSYYDIDRGIDPDVHLTRITTFYDRDRLTGIINDLY